MAACQNQNSKLHQNKNHPTHLLLLHVTCSSISVGSPLCNPHPPLAGKLTCQPIYSRIVSLFAEQNDLMYAVPGGLIGVGTKVGIEYHIRILRIHVRRARWAHRSRHQGEDEISPDDIVNHCPVDSSLDTCCSKPFQTRQLSG